jgi:hypothetical protein
MTVTVKPPATWHPDDGPDPSWRCAVLEVTGAAPGRWTVRSNGAGWYLHISHNGHHIGMANWNQWDTVAAYIAHESGPYTVTVTSGDLAGTLHNLTLTDARLAVVRAETDGATAVITNADGNEVRFPRRPKLED